ncbi:MAG: hypothetical protein IJ081_03410 [Prevotella sp.]|nr:hypothetical protein [Prevotella sp.]
MMQKWGLLLSLVLLISCGDDKKEVDDGNIVSRFNSTWNIYEKCFHNDDGSVTYESQPWGGLVAQFSQKNMPVDWSNYESITFEFSQPTQVGTQIMLSDRVKTWGKPGITSLTCNFDGKDVSQIDEVVLQTSDTSIVNISRVSLRSKDGAWESQILWKGNCEFGNWTGGFVIKPEQFDNAVAGDKLEFIITNDHSDPSVSYWLMKTIYSGTDQTLEGNNNELNDWGCATMGSKATSYRISLTENDVVQLRSKGLFVNGYYTIVKKCNLLHKVLKTDET